MLDKTLRILRFLVVPCALVATTILAPTAGATWGKECKHAANSHCYSIARWKMTGNGYGGGEEVKGLDSEFYTTTMLVPNWEQPETFVSNEQWMLGPSGGWAEVGEIAGATVNDDALMFFWAFKVGSGTLHVTPTSLQVEGYQWHNYAAEDPNNNGDWCVTFNTYTEACESGFSDYATEVEVGMEAADEAQPENAGKDKTGVEHLSGGWYHWNKATLETRQYGGANESAYICAASWESYSGYIQWGSPKSSYPC